MKQTIIQAAESIGLAAMAAGAAVIAGGGDIAHTKAALVALIIAAGHAAWTAARKELAKELEGKS